jgi:D-tyrosyl-tRNA(Tyr) deacylase
MRKRKPSLLAQPQFSRGCEAAAATLPSGVPALGAMRVVLQRVSHASVSVHGTVVGAIDRGLALLVGFNADDGPEQLEWMAEKILGLRVFGDAEGKMNLDVRDVAGAALVVSQFTLYGDARKGRRPSFVSAAPPEQAEPLYRGFVEALRTRGLRVETGEFGAVMEVAIVNDGPVTLVLER